jgi:hypothetical protein
MENNYTVKYHKRGEWQVMDADGDVFAVLSKYGRNQWMAFDWEDGVRLFIDEQPTYYSSDFQTALEIAQLIEY